MGSTAGRVRDSRDQDNAVGCAATLRSYRVLRIGNPLDSYLTAIGLIGVRTSKRASSTARNRAGERISQATKNSCVRASMANSLAPVWRGRGRTHPRVRSNGYGFSRSRSRIKVKRAKRAQVSPGVSLQPFVSRHCLVRRHCLLSIVAARDTCAQLHYHRRRLSSEGCVLWARTGPLSRLCAPMFRSKEASDARRAAAHTCSLPRCAIRSSSVQP